MVNGCLDGHGALKEHGMTYIYFVSEQHGTI